MDGKRIARVFVKKTQYTPTDDLCFFTRPGLIVPEVDEVHVSCLFSWDRLRAEALAKAWKSVAPVKIGGPAYSFDGGGGGDFAPSLYVKEGYTFSSRGCPRKCPFCLIQKQEGGIRELSVIHSGNKLLDNNLLACSRKHIEKVFSMLEKQRDVMLMGGLDVRLLKKWHADRIKKLHLRDLAIAFDSEGLEKHLERSLGLLHGAGIPHGKCHCFILGGFSDKDTPEKAEERCRLVLKLGATPTAMFYRSPTDMEERRPRNWSKWINRWSWQSGVYAMAKREGIPTYQKAKDGCKESEDN